MKKIILHIGTPKSGTSALQNFLNSNRNVLKQYNYCYPKDKDAKHTEITMGNGRQLYDYARQGDVEKARDYIKEILSKYNETHVVLSSEGFYFHPKFIHEVIPEAKIVVYFREQSEKIISSYGQRIKGDPSFQKGIYEYVNSILNGDEDKIHGNYYLDKWMQLYGEKNIILRPYEYEQFEGGTIFFDFLSAIGIKAVQDFILPQKKINPSYTRNALEYKLLLNRLMTPNNNKMNQLIRNLLQRYSEAYPDKHKFAILSLLQKHDIANHFKESNSYIAQKYLDRDNGILFYDVQRDKEEKSYQGLSIEAIHGITRYLINQNPDLLNFIIKLILEGLKSEEQQIKNAAYKLLPIFSLYKCYQFLNNNIIQN